MPERISSLWHWIQTFASPLLFAFVGIIIGVGQLLASGEVLTLRIIIGRSLSTAGIAMAAGAVLVLVPDLPLVGQIGVAALLASLGTSGLERLFQRVIQGRAA
ncbi:hypothetical protein [Dechloromonas sp. CZR5]|uniref:hypothetical protein n=1 Tax=Dechloromonas sp. CZR5 TaxID=2608630 RepID=UPI00123DE929|nr:hypothetical protein [Dechloromonas sp. CZR5]